MNCVTYSLIYDYYYYYFYYYYYYYYYYYCFLYAKLPIFFYVPPKNAF